MEKIVLPTSRTKHRQQTKEPVFVFSFRLKKLVGRAQSVCLWKLSFFLCLLWTTIQILRHISAALSVRKPEFQNSLAVLGTRREEGSSVVGVLCSGCSWCMIHQGLVPSGIDESITLQCLYQKQGPGRISQSYDQFDGVNFTFALQTSHGEAGNFQNHILQIVQCTVNKYLIFWVPLVG